MRLPQAEVLAPVLSKNVKDTISCTHASRIDTHTHKALLYQRSYKKKLIYDTRICVLFLGTTVLKKIINHIVFDAHIMIKFGSEKRRISKDSEARRGPGTHTSTVRMCQINNESTYF